MAPRVVVTSTVRRRRWPWVLVLLLLVIPTLEIAVIVWVGRQIGPWPTLLLLVAESALGAWLVKREGARSWDALNAALSSGRMPSRQLADTALILIGGTLLLTPGFVTDVAGFFCILPLTRPLARSALETVVTRRLLGSAVMFSQRPSTTPGAPTQPSGDWRPEPGPSRSAASAEVIEGEIID
ncbi:MAG: FxsA family protein [Dermatophilaceae bacterium]